MREMRMREGVKNNNKLFSFVMIWIKKVLLKVR